MSHPNEILPQLLARQIRIRNLQERWNRVSSLSLEEFEQLWNETANEIPELKGRTWIARI